MGADFTNPISPRSLDFDYQSPPIGVCDSGSSADDFISVISGETIIPVHASPITPRSLDFIYESPPVDGCVQFSGDGSSDDNGDGGISILTDVVCGGFFDYGLTSVGIPKTHTFTLTNYGKGKLYINDFLVQGAEFQALTSPAHILYPGASTSFDIRYAPTLGGEFNGAFSFFTSEGGGTLCVVQLKGTAVTTLVVCTAWEGHFQFYGYKPYTIGQDVSEYYLNKSGSGQLTILHGGIPVTPEDAYGSSKNVFSGSLQVNSTNGTVTGEIVNDQSVEGVLCSGSSYSYNADLQYRLVSTSGLDALLSSAGVFRIAWAYTRTESLQKTWTNYNFPGPGSGITYCDNGINGVTGEQAMESLSNRMTIQQASHNGGGMQLATSDCTSRGDAADGNGGVDGKIAVAHLSYLYPSVQGSFLIEVHLSYTPTGGGATVFETIEFEVPVGVGSYLNYDYNIPVRVGFVTQFISASIFDLQAVSDDFQAQPLNKFYGDLAQEYIQTIQWKNPPAFMMPLPGTECWNDWEEEQVNGAILTGDRYGHYWAGPGTFLSTDPTQVYDDFENYTPGPVSYLGSGIGWVRPGSLLFFDIQNAFDDFESYATGPITALTFETSLISSDGFLWTGNGSFYSTDYVNSNDDFEAESVGAITTFTHGFNWSGNGRIIP